MSTNLGASHSVEGLHLNCIPGSFRPPLGAEYRAISSEEQQYLDRATQFASLEGAYSLLQATKPQTLSFALSDSAIGLLSWMTKKFASWSYCDGDLETVFRPMRCQRTCRSTGLATLSTPPSEYTRKMSFAHFPKELPTTPCSWVERVFNVRRWTEMAKGGHFAALEQPVLLARDIQDSFRKPAS